MEESSREAGRTVVPMSDEFRAELKDEGTALPRRILPSAAGGALAITFGGVVTWILDPSWAAIIFTLVVLLILAAAFGVVVGFMSRDLRREAEGTEMVRACGRGKFARLSSYDSGEMADAELHLADWADRVVATLRVSLSQRETLDSFAGTWMEVDATVEGNVVIVRDRHGRRIL